MKRILGIGGGGKICRETIIDLVVTTTANEFSKITVASRNEEAGGELVKFLDVPRVDFKRVDVNKTDELIKLMKQYDLVMSGTSLGLNPTVMSCAARAKIPGISLS